MPWDFLVVANPVWETARLVDRIPKEPGQETRPDAPAGREADCDVVTDGGGSALNTACALAMAGRRVLAVGRVGDDVPGRACLDALQRRGVETVCEVLCGRTTKRNTCFVEQGTHATAFAVELPARSVPPWEETPDALLEARILLLDRLAAAAPAWLKARTEPLGKERSGTPAQFSRRMDHREETNRVKAGRDATGRHETRINAFVRNSAILSPAAMNRFISALPHLGYLQVSEEAAMEASSGTARTVVLPESGRRTLLSPTSPDEAPPERGRIHRPRSLQPLAAEEIAAILASGMRLLVRTRGAHGVVVHTAEGLTVELPAVPTEVVDPTGAGDAFAAGFLDAFLDGLDPAASAKRGLDWAARACRHLGARAWVDHEPPR
jgi:sugar/nucleoside kinase (ribokinase family)